MAKKYEIVDHNAYEAVTLPDGQEAFDLLTVAKKDPLRVGSKLGNFKGVLVNNPIAQGLIVNDDSSFMPADLPLLIASPSKFGSDSPDCMSQLHMLEDFAQAHTGEVTVVQFSVQNPQYLALLAREEKIKQSRLLGVTQETARKLGAQISPARHSDGMPAADITFWNQDTTARTAALLTPVGRFGRRKVGFRHYEPDQAVAINRLALKHSLKSLAA